MSMILKNVQCFSGALSILRSRSTALACPTALCTLKQLQAKPRLRLHPFTVCTKLRHPTEQQLTGTADEGIWKRITSKIRWVYRDQHQVALSAGFQYETCVDNVNCALFMEHFHLPDTYMSWFYITELHVCMCCVRAAREGKEGQFLLEQIVVNMWKDVELRMKKLGHISSKFKRDGLITMNNHFGTALTAYTDGLIGNDGALAAALRTTLLSDDCKDPHHLEVLVQYARKNLNNLDNLSRSAVLYEGKIDWIPLESFLKDHTSGH